MSGRYFSNKKSLKITNDGTWTSRSEGWQDGQCEGAEFVIVKGMKFEETSSHVPFCHPWAREILASSFVIFKLFPLKNYCSLDIFVLDFSSWNCKEIQRIRL